VEVLVATENRAQQIRARSASLGPRRGFSLIDVLVSMTVIGVLIGILLPSLASVHETARRTVCTSNLRQIGFGVASFADENGGRLPSSVFKQGGSMSVQDMMTLRIASTHPAARSKAQWDGLGILHEGEYLRGPKVYYCPSHHGEHHFRVYAPEWGERAQTELVSNYQYRGSGRDGVRDLYRITPSRTALVSDGMRTQNDFNHNIGANILRADLSTGWIDDRVGLGVTMLYSLGAGSDAPISSGQMDEAWRRLDEADAAR
jgi:prepilin-type N-terminal cleavage/methylation domain-containing protein